MSREISAGAVIFKKEDSKIYYLLLHYGPRARGSGSNPASLGHWDFAKGHIEGKEDEIKTVKREIEEETGIKDIKIIDGFKEKINYSFSDRKNKSWIFKTVTFYLAETKIRKIKLSYEHIGFRWLNYSEALKQLTFKNARDILKKADYHLNREKG